MWLLVTTLTQFYKVKEQAEQREIPNVQFEERSGTRKFHVGAKACAERDKEKRKNGGVPSGQDSIRIDLPLVKRKGLRKCMLLKSIIKSKLWQT